MPLNYFSRVRNAIWYGVCSISGKESGIRNQVYFLIVEGNVFLGDSRLVHSVPSGIFFYLPVLVRPVTVAAAQANSYIAKLTNNFSVVRAFSRANSTPVSGHSYQICRHHVDCLLSEPSHSTCIKSDVALMDVCGSRSDPAPCSMSNLISLPAQPGVAAYHSFSSYSRRSFDNCRKASMCLRNKGQPNNFLLYGYFMYSVVKRRGYANPFFGSKIEDLYISSISCSPSGTARDLSFDNSLREEQRPSSADSSKLNIKVDRTLKLNSGSCYLPHPDKEETGGEDAHFICKGEHAIV